MAMRYSSLYSSPILSLDDVSSKGSTNSRVAMCANTSHFSVKALGRSSVRNKVFEDQSAGVVCYKDENGEITCEGVDEGPRFQPQVSFYNNNNKLRKIDLFQRCWIQPIDEDHELQSGDKGFSVQTDFNFNGSNKLG